MQSQSDQTVTLTSQILGELITEYFDSSRGVRDCRLLVPGLTRRIAREVHHYLRNRDVNSFLVIGQDQNPSEPEQTIRAVALTSKRIGSFVAVAEPGQLVNIQDSIRGSGGTIRAPAFSEEWPWIDNGSEPFQFDGPFLDALVRRWTDDPRDQDWLREFILYGLVEHTRPSSRRADILLERILGFFNPSLYPKVEDIREKLLFYSGIARPTDTLQRPETAIRNSDRLCRYIVRRFRQDEDVRNHAHDMVRQLVDPAENDEVRELLDRFLDRLGRSEWLDLGMLAFHDCWSGPEQWSRLDADLLAKLFGVEERPESKITSITPSCQRAVIDDRGKMLATFVGEEILLDIEYEIPTTEFRGTWFLQVLNRQTIIAQKQLFTPQGQACLDFNTADVASYLRKVPLRLALIQDNEAQAEERFYLHLCGPERPTLVIVEQGFEVADPGPDDEDESPDKKVETEEPAHLFLVGHDIEEQKVALRDQDDIDIDKISIAPGIWRSSHRIDPSNFAGQAVISCYFGDSSAVVCLEATDVEKGQFTLEDELRTSIIDGSDGQVRELLKIFEGSRREPYSGLGKMDDAGRRRAALSRVVSGRTGWRPVLTDLLHAHRQGVLGLGNFILQLGPVSGEAFRSLELPEEALVFLKSYTDARDAVLQAVQTNLDEIAAHIEHPTYATHPIFVESSSADMDTKLQDYLSAYSQVLEYLRTSQQALEWPQLFVLAHLDCVVHWDRGDLRNSFYLVGPWHPLVVSKRFMVQAALHSRGQRLVEGKKEFRRLTTLLGSVQGFRWMAGLSLTID